eukprot:160429_1
MATQNEDDLLLSKTIWSISKGFTRDIILSLGSNNIERWRIADIDDVNVQMLIRKIASFVSDTFPFRMAKFFNRFVNPKVSDDVIFSLCNNSSYHPQQDNELIQIFDEKMCQKFIQQNPNENYENPSKLELALNLDSRRTHGISRQVIKCPNRGRERAKIQAIQIQKSKLLNTNKYMHFVAFARLFFRCFTDTENRVIWDDRRNGKQFKQYRNDQIKQKSEKDKSMQEIDDAKGDEQKQTQQSIRDEYKFACTHCDRRFPTKEARDNHVAANIIPDESEHYRYTDDYDIQDDYKKDNTEDFDSNQYKDQIIEAYIYGIIRENDMDTGDKMIEYIVNKIKVYIFMMEYFKHYNANTYRVSDDNMTVRRIGDGGFCYGASVISSVDHGVYQWNLKIIGQCDWPHMAIGIDEATYIRKKYGCFGDYDESEETNAYAFYCNGDKYRRGCNVEQRIEADDNSPRFNEHDVVLMILDLSNQTLSYKINDGDEYVAFTNIAIGDDINYTMVVYMQYTDESIELLNCLQL